MSKPDPFSRHEVLHTSHLIADMFDRHIADHAFTRSQPDLSAQAEAISDALNAFYQAVGAHSLAGLSEESGEHP